MENVMKNKVNEQSALEQVAVVYGEGKEDSQLK